MSNSKHDERRRKIAEVVMRVIARDGLEAATVRRIAAEVGYSTTVITHYFSDKREMLMLAYRAHGKYARDQFEAAAVREAKDLANYLMSMAAYDEPRLALWRAYIAIWDRSLRDPEFLVQLRSWNEESLDRVEFFIGKLNPRCKESRKIAQRLLAVVQGISIQQLFDPECWTKVAMRETLMSEIKLLIFNDV